MCRMCFLVVMVLTTASGTVRADHGGSIALFADIQGTNCNLPMIYGAEQEVYAVHVLGTASGYTEARFYVSWPVCMWDWNHISVTAAPGMTYEGHWYGENPGLHVFGPAWTTPRWLLTFQVRALSEPDCCYWRIVGHPDDGLIRVLDDDADEWVQVTGGSIIMNPQPSCQCSVPVWNTTWGRVKALYTAID